MTAVLVELAQTLVADFSIQEMLDYIAESVMSVLDVAGAGVLLLDGEGALRYASATDHTIRQLVTLQVELGEGPCLTTYQSGERVAISDIAAAYRTYPVFARRAAAAEIDAIYTFPLRLNGQHQGALSLYEGRPRVLDSEEVLAAQILADVATVYLFNAQARSATEERTLDLQFRALHDPLTGLPNRTLLADRLTHALAGLPREDHGVGVLFIDIDRFKAINDNYGHQVGDKLLIALAERLDMLLRPTDTLARLAGDEFVVLCEHLEDREDAEAIAARAAEAVRAPFLVDDLELTIGVSVGVATTWDDPQAHSDLILHADAAMYRAKRRGGDCSEASVCVGAAELEPRRHVARDLKSAIASGQLTMHYQPIVEAEGGDWCSIEALLRWDHPQIGAVAAPLIVDVAERIGMAAELAQWTLTTACAGLHACGAPELGVAINVSPRQLVDPRFLAAVSETLQRSEISGGRLCIEVTEEALIHDLRGAIASMAALRALGVTVALDDFGTGYSSLTYLKRLPVGLLKIDRSFVTALASEPLDRAIVSAVVGLADVAELKIVAEGIETDEQLDLMRNLGCHLAQGHWIGRPVPADQLAECFAASC